MNHTPVLLNEVIAALAPHAGERMIDATFGAGGYTRSIAARGARVLGIDQDPAVIARAETPPGSTLVQGKFGDIAALARANGFDSASGAVFDIGVSSMQLDEAARGFSFMKDGPLDMRMSGAGTSAADIVNMADEGDLVNIIFNYGEEPHARRIARAIGKARMTATLTSTLQLAEIVASVVHGRPGHHPATRTFQALRIYVNDELGQLRAGLEGALEILAPGGRLAVVTFHSLEDRIVKQFLLERSNSMPNASRYLPVGGTNVAAPVLSLPQRKAITPSLAESSANPRARSAKLRVAVRTEHPFFLTESDELLMETAA